MTTEELSNPTELLERALRGDAEAVRELFSGQRERLKRLVRLRLGRELAGRVDESKVVDEILAQAKERLAAFAREQVRPLSLWVRDLGCRRLAELQGDGPEGAGRHGGETVGGPVTLHSGGLPIADAGALAARLFGATARPRALERVERRIDLQEALNTMDPIDREVIALKHFERLGMSEIAEVLGLTESDVGRRYLGAIRRLRGLLPWDGGSRHS
jgi:RNA polymerase sigma-70 factor (ECF subfamily)